jgi:hypothetical protein
MAPERIALTALALSFWLGAHQATGQPAGAPAGEQAAWNFVGNVVHILASGYEGAEDDEEEGYGFAVGERDGHALIVTANHVVRKAGNPAHHITLQYANDGGRMRDAILLEPNLPQGAGDLAILEAPLPSGNDLQWPAMVPSYQMRPGMRAWRIGKRGRFVPAASPGLFVGRIGVALLEFDDLDTPSGSSGGPVLGDGGLVGMVVADGGLTGVPARVLPIDTIGAVVKSWGLPWQINEPPASRQAVARPATSPEAPRPSEPRPPLTRPLMADMAQDLIRRLLAALAADSDASLEALYAPRVLYAGKLVQRSDVLGQQHLAAVRWPARRFVLRPGAVQTDCNVVVGTCLVEANVDWVLQGPGEPTRSGRSHYTLSLDFSRGQPLIVTQTSTESR